jgi:hypothetical protein
MPLDPETVHLISTNSAAMEKMANSIEAHDTTSSRQLEQILISSNASVGVLEKIHATLNNGLVQEIGEVLASQIRCEEQKKRDAAVKAGRKPRSRLNDSMWLRIVKYGGGGALLGGLGFDVWAGALAKFFSALAGG